MKRIHNKFDPRTFITRSRALAKLDEPKCSVAQLAKISPPEKSFEELLTLRPYQLPILRDEKTGILVLHWSRQIGKSFVLAAWAVKRLIDRPGRLVTVLSNSRENGAEFLAKCAEVCRIIDCRHETEDKSPSLPYAAMKMELRIADNGTVGRIKVLAANPRTARGFSGDLILDEFAFHEDSATIWEAVEPILASNPDFLCRIASTGNGKHNMFYKMASGAPVSDPARTMEFPKDSETATDGEKGKDLFSSAVVSKSAGQHHRAGPEAGAQPQRSAPVPGAAMLENPAAFLSSKDNGTSHVAAPGDGRAPNASPFQVSRIPRSLAYTMGAKIFDPATREEITPAQARERALDKRAYDQNYECSFADESLTLLTHELISAAECDGVGEICEQRWSTSALGRLREANSPLYAGFDVARNGDLSVITVLEKLDNIFYARAILRMRDLRLPEQQERLAQLCALPLFARVAIDMTGLGLGLFEYAQAEFGSRKIQGVNFATTVPVTGAIAEEGRRGDKVRVTEALALELLRVYEARRMRHPADAQLMDDLRKPERVTTPGGRVSIAATRTEAGHADHFWSLALALEAAATARPRRIIPSVFDIKPSTSWEDRRIIL